MNKKYKLVIPEMIKSDDAWILSALSDFFCSINSYEKVDGVIIDENTKSNASTVWVWDFEDIPKDWLQEIKEPMTFEECNENFGFEQEYYDILLSIENHLLSGFSKKWIDLIKKEREKFWMAAIENERLKHESKQTCEEWYESFTNWEEIGTNIFSEIEKVKAVWKACEKNRGYEV